MQIQKMTKSQLPEVKKLVFDVFMEFEAPDYSEEGIQSFLTTALNNEEFMSSLDIFGAFEDDVLVGIIATRSEGKHIALFFVDGSHHKKGIGRKLFTTMLEAGTAKEITVNSSPYAKEVYHRLGFQDTDMEQTVTGIRFIPMVFKK